MDKKKTREYKKMLTPECHFKASVMFYNLTENGIVPDYVTWEVPDQHKTLLKLFIVDGLNFREIRETGLISSRRNQKMSQDTIKYWINKYIPFLEYQTKKSTSKRNQDPAERHLIYMKKRYSERTPCAICGSEKNLELDHIIPYWMGGTATEDNLQWLCYPCHKDKTKKEMADFWSYKADLIRQKESSKTEGGAA